MILVTGGNGFIGRSVCARLRKKEKECIVFDRTAPQKDIISPDFPFEEGDVRERARIVEIFSYYDITTVIHLATILQTASRKNPAEATEVNVLGGMNVLETAVAYHARRFIFASSVSVYGPKTGAKGEGVSETEPEAPRDVYAAGKRYIEIAGESYRTSGEIEFVSLRISPVIGPGAAHTASPWRSDIFEKTGSPEKTEIHLPFSKDVLFPFVYLGDVADILIELALAEHPEHAIYNSPSETWVAGELADYIRSLDERIEFTYGHSDLGGLPRFISGERYRKEFGFTPQSIKIRLRQAYEENKAHHQTNLF